MDNKEIIVLLKKLALGVSVDVDIGRLSMSSIKKLLLDDNITNILVKTYYEKMSIHMRCLFDSISIVDCMYSNIDSIVVFGSFTRKPMQEKITHQFLWKKWIEIKESIPNDIDICVFVRNLDRILLKKIAIPFDVSHYRVIHTYTGMYWDWRSFKLKDGMHLFFTTDEEFAIELKNKRSEMVNIQKEGICLCGENKWVNKYIKYSLDDDNVLWGTVLEK